MSGPRPMLAIGPLPPPWHGQATAFKVLMDGMRARGVPCRVLDLLPDKGPDAAVSAGGAGRLRGLGLALPRYGAAILMARRTVVYLTVAQSWMGFLRDAWLIWCAALRGHRIVTHLHGGNYDSLYEGQRAWRRALIRVTLRRVDVMIVLGESLRGQFAFEPRLASRLTVVPNGTTPAIENASPRGLPAPPAPVELLYLSNLVESKGYFAVLEVAELLQKRGIAVRAHFAGRFLANPSDDIRVTDAQQAQRIFEREVAERGLTSNAVWHGAVAGERKRALLARAHFLVLPTRYDNEGQPLAIIEAMSAGVVPVSTPYRAIPDLIEDGETGLLVPADRPAEMAFQIISVIRTAERYRRMSEAALERYRQLFTDVAHVDRMLDVLLPGSGGNPGPDAIGFARR